MNKSQLIEALSTRFDGNKKDAQHALESVLDAITRAVASGEKVSVTGFGAFEKVDRPARMVRNPRTGERKRAKKTSVPKFRAGAELKAIVSGEKKLPKLKPATAAKSTATRATAKKATTKSAAAKKSTRSTATKSTAKKATATRSTAKKATAKRTTKTTAKRATGRRAAKR